LTRYSNRTCCGGPRNELVVELEGRAAVVGGDAVDAVEAAVVVGVEPVGPVGPEVKPWKSASQSSDMGGLVS